MSKPTIHELESILNNGDQESLVTRQDGEVSTETLEFNRGAAIERAKIITELRQKATSLYSILLNNEAKHFEMAAAFLESGDHTSQEGDPGKLLIALAEHDTASVAKEDEG